MQKFRNFLCALQNPNKRIQIIEFISFSVFSIIFAFLYMFAEMQLFKYISLSLLLLGCVNPYTKNRVLHILFLIPFSSLFHFGMTFGLFTLCLGVEVVFTYITEIYHVIKNKETKLADKNLILLISLSSLFLILTLITSVIVGTNKTNLISLVNFALYLFFFVHICFLLKMRRISINVFEFCLYGFAIASLVSLPSVINENYYNLLYKIAGNDHVIVYKSTLIFGGNIKFLAFTGLQTEPNYLGFVMLMSICGLIAFTKLDKNHPFLRLIAILICCLSGLLTLSITFLICFLLLLGMLLAHFFFKLKINHSLTLLVLLPVIALLFFIFSNSNPFSLSYTTGNVRIFINSFTTGRSELAILSAEQFCSSIAIFLFGRGWNNLQLLYDAHASHSLLFDCLNSVGLSGFLLLILIFSFFIKNIKSGNNISLKGNLYYLISFLIPILIELMSLPSFGSWFFLLPFFSVLLPVLYIKKEIQLNENQYTVDI